MPQLLKTLLIVLATLMILSVNSCGINRPKFDPDAYRANHFEQAIINEDQVTVYCYEEKFSEFACMHKEKWEELRRLIQTTSQIPKPVKDELLKTLDKVIDKK